MRARFGKGVFGGYDLKCGYSLVKVPSRCSTHGHNHDIQTLPT